MAVRVPLGTSGRTSTNDKNPAGADVLWKTVPKDVEGDYLPRHELGRGVKLLTDAVKDFCYGCTHRVRSDDLVQRAKNRILLYVHS